jgi:hypothetical protein
MYDTKFILISIRNDDGRYTYVDEFKYDRNNQFIEDQLFRILKNSVDKKSYITINKSNGAWVKCNKNEYDYDVLYSIDKFDKFIHNYSIGLLHDIRGYRDRLPNISRFISSKIERLYYCKNISFYDHPLVHEFYEHLLKIVKLFKNERDLSKYIKALSKKLNFISGDLVFSYLKFYPCTYIIHVINENNVLVKRYIEVTGACDTALSRKLAPCINLISDGYDCFNYDVTDIDNAIFHNSDEKVKYVVDNRHLIELPINKYENLRDYLSKRFMHVKSKYYEVKNPHGGSFHNDFILNKLDGETSTNGNIGELRLIYSISTH